MDALFHHLWTKAVSTPDYDKREWIALEAEFLTLRRTLKSAIAALENCVELIDPEQPVNPDLTRVVVAGIASDLVAHWNDPDRRSGNGVEHSNQYERRWPEKA